jgi:hypothetical protein
MNILFHSNQLGVRGTEVALYDYAHYNETILGNVSYIAAPANSDLSAIEKFKTRFGDRVILYNHFSELGVSSSYRIDVAYFIKAGFNDGLIYPGAKNIVHAVFDASDKHGDVYVAVSEWLGKKHNVEYLPHIVSLPDIKEDFRDFIGASNNDIIFGRYGGFDQFDIPYLGEVIKVAADKGIKFLFMNTKQLNFQHPNVIYSEANTDMNTKTAFINTCDAMIHGRTDGESFGLAIAEFTHQNKPVVTSIHCRDRNHIHVLGDKGLYYSNGNELYAILTSFEKKDYNVKPLVDQFKPEIIMQKFKSLISE